MGWVYTVMHTWRSKNNFCGSVFSFHPVGAGNQIQAVWAYEAIAFIYRTISPAQQPGILQAD